MIMSFMLFNPANYGKFFLENGSMTLIAGLSMLLGVSAFIFLWLYNVKIEKKGKCCKSCPLFVKSQKKKFKKKKKKDKKKGKKSKK